MKAVEKHIDKIIEAAAHEVADTIKRSKKYKAVLDSLPDMAGDT